MALTPHDSSGTTFDFKGTKYTVTNITYTLGAVGGAGGDKIDVSHLAQTTGEAVLTMNRPLIGSAGGGDTGKSVSIEYLGTAPIAQNSSGQLVITGPLNISATATCNSSSVTLSVNDVIRGTAEFALA